MLVGLRKRWKRVVLGGGLAIAALVYGAVRGKWAAADVLAAAGLFVAIAGFSVTISLLIYSARISVVTQRAIVDTLRAVAAGRLYIAVTELQLIEEAVEAAALHDDREIARSLLNRWRHRATEVEGLLQHRYGEKHSYEKVMLRSAAAILRAKENLFDEQHDTRTATKAAAKTMQAVCAELGPLLGELIPLLPTELRDE